MTQRQKKQVIYDTSMSKCIAFDGVVRKACLVIYYLSRNQKKEKGPGL